MDSGSSNSHRNIRAGQILVWWLVWVAILGGVAIVYFFLGRRSPARLPEMSAAAVMDYAAIGPVIVSSVIRWLWFPRIEKRQQAFAVFIMGLALAEGTGFIGIFVTQQSLTLTLLSALGIVQWMPLFAGKYPPVGPPQRT